MLKCSNKIKKLVRFIFSNLGVKLAKPNQYFSAEIAKVSSVTQVNKTIVICKTLSDHALFIYMSDKILI